MSAQTSDSGAESEAPEAKIPDSSKKEQEDGEELPFIEAFSVVFNVASCLGLHIVRRDDLGVYRISWWKVGTSLLSLINATIGFLTVGYIYLYTGISYYQQVMLLPIVCGCFFYFYGYILWMHTFRDYINYLTVLEANNLKIKKNVYLPLIIIGIAVYSFIYTCCLSLTALLPRETVYELQSILFVISFIPSFLDLHMFSFVKLLITALAKLEKRVRGIEHWTTDDVSLVAQEWLRLCNLFHEHNKNFQYPLHIRLVLLMVQAMTFMFSLVVLRPSKSCLTLMLPTLVPLAELSIRFLCVCLVGEILRKTVSKHNEEVCIRMSL
ncbi:uncharacterized protein LOC121870195 [Homarus americanus]|uniref:uncharacterized protein LOC121870195 n=1 Tax=Homarus americanus TaxID=6706 RepID=UPI001C48BBCA|nr:uncharacterized protein LOC121870195 [Homarus americanus]